MNRFYTKAICSALFFHLSFVASAQDSPLNKYGLWVISDVTSYTKSIQNKPGLALCDVKKLIPGLEIDLRYASANNFTHKKIYAPTITTYLRKKAASALVLVQKELNLKGLGLKIFDAYRPYAATELMWDLVKDERYAANPKNGSGHNRGVAVDLTIINLKTRKELAMGTGFDNFTDTAHHEFTCLPATILQNRLLLKTTMEKFGFKALETEWWHYSLPDSKNYPLLNLGFELLKKLRLSKI
jgi:D-alanyl-D-alanine dipeptidase